MEDKTLVETETIEELLSRQAKDIFSNKLDVSHTDDFNWLDNVADCMVFGLQRIVANRMKVNDTMNDVFSVISEIKKDDRVPVDVKESLEMVDDMLHYLLV